MPQERDTYNRQEQRGKNNLKYQIKVINMETQTTYITKEMTMGEIIEKYPFASEVMLSYGLHCVGCHVNPYESLENGALGHGMSDEEIASLLQELNDLVKTNGAKPDVVITDAEVTITQFAVTKVMEMMKTHAKEGQGLRASSSSP